MRNTPKRLACILVVCSLLLSFAACGTAAPAAGYLDLPDSPSTTLNSVWYNTGGIFRCAVFDALVSTDADMKTIRPALAEKYEASPDGRTYTFVLRKTRNGTTARVSHRRTCSSP